MSGRRSRFPMFLYGLLGVAVIVYLVSTRDGDLERIDHQLDEIREGVEKSGPESNLDALARARGLGELFSETFEIRLIPFGEVLRDRPALLRSLIATRNQFDTIGIDFRDKSVEVITGPGRKTAEMSCTVVVTSNGELGRTRDGYRFRFFWIEEGGEWLLERVDMEEILEGARLL